MKYCKGYRDLPVACCCSSAGLSVDEGGDGEEGERGENFKRCHFYFESTSLNRFCSLDKL